MNQIDKHEVTISIKYLSTHIFAKYIAFHAFSRYWTLISDWVLIISKIVNRIKPLINYIYAVLSFFVNDILNSVSTEKQELEPHA